MTRRAALLGLLTLGLGAQAPLLQDGAVVLRRDRLDWTLGQEPLEPSGLPSFEVGWGGAGTQGLWTPLLGGEGLGTGTAGWGLGFQGRWTKAGLSIAATALALRDGDRTLGILQRGSVAYRWDSSWRLALEQTPLAWGAGLLGGELLGDGVRPFPRLALSTPTFDLPLGRWRLEAFRGRLEGPGPLPDTLPQLAQRQGAAAAGLDLARPWLQGGLLVATFAERLELTFGSLALVGGTDAQGRLTSASATQTARLAQARLRWPEVPGASLLFSRSGWDGTDRTLAGLQLARESWDATLEWAGAARLPAGPLALPQHLAGFSSRGDALGTAFGPYTATRSAAWGLPLPWEGRGRLLLVRATTPLPSPAPEATWLLQGEARWRTAFGRLGATVASRRDTQAGHARWGWSFTCFQAFRVF